MYITTIKNNYSYRFFYHYDENGKWILIVRIDKGNYWLLFDKIELLEMWNGEIIKHSFLHSELKKQLLIVNKYKDFLLGI